MDNYNLSHEARNDLRRIYKFSLLNFGIIQAKTYLIKITSILNALANKSITGRSADNLTLGLRKIEIGSHIVFYFNKDKIILVIRVLHKSMDFEKHI